MRLKINVEFEIIEFEPIDDIVGAVSEILEYGAYYLYNADINVTKIKGETNDN